MVPPSASPARSFLRRLGGRYTNLSWYSRGQGTDKSTILTRTVSPPVTQKPSHPSASSPNPIRCVSTRLILSLEDMLPGTCSRLRSSKCLIPCGPDLNMMRSQQAIFNTQVMGRYHLSCDDRISLEAVCPLTSSSTTSYKIGMHGRKVNIDSHAKKWAVWNS